MTEIPQPDAIVALVEELTRYPWPKNQSEKDALFKRLGVEPQTTIYCKHQQCRRCHGSLSTRNQRR